MTETQRKISGKQIIAFAILGAITLLGFASPLLPPELVNSLAPWLAGVRANPWAPAAAVLGFALFASIGVPQIVLITAVVAAFGPWLGLAYSWSGKMIACCLGFLVGRRFGAQLVDRYANARVHALMRQLARRGFLASALIRLVPTVPSVLINIAAGATPICFRDFFFGTALGSVPKMALMAFGGHAAMEVVRNNSSWAWIVLAAVFVLWGILALLARRWMRAERDQGAGENL